MTTKSVLSLALLAFACVLSALPARAQTRVFVAAQGSDSNPCTFALPCRTFQHAHDIVAGNGEIDVLDPAGYGQLSITKSISIQGHGFSGVSVASGGTGITVHAPETAIVNLSGLLIDGAGVGSTGIALITAQSLTITDTMVRNFVSSGIALAPNNTAHNAAIAVSRTFVANNGGHGIYFQPTSSGVTIEFRASFNHVEVQGSGLNGIAIFGNLASSIVKAFAVDTVVTSSNGAGFYALTAALDLYRSAAFNNVNNVFGDTGGIISVAQSHVGTPHDGTSSGWTGCVASYGDNYTAGESNPGSCGGFSKF